MLGISPFFYGMREEVLWPGGPVLETHPGVFPLGTDAVLLADFCNAPKEGCVCDLGSGTGFLLVRLLWENPGLFGMAAEIDAAAAENTRVNLRRNGLSGRGCVCEEDLRQMGEQGEFDLAVANPPYFPKESPGKNPARKETYLTFRELCETAFRMLKPQGRFCFVHRPERLAELCRTLEETGFTLSHRCTVRDRADKAPCLVLVEAVRDGKEKDCRCSELILRDENGGYTREYQRIYRMEE